MAGLYPDVPDHRIPYDRDGTVVLFTTLAAVIHTYPNSELVKWNGEAATSPLHISNDQGWHVWMFPEPMDIVGYFKDSQLSSSPRPMHSSVDTTNGIDGTWVEVLANYKDSSVGNAPVTLQRNDIQTVSTAVAGIKALRFYKSHTGTRNPYHLHLFGTRTTPGDNMEIWHPTLNEAVGGAYFDWAEQEVDDPTWPTRDFRVKNHSATETAVDVQISIEALTDSAFTSNVDQHEFSEDGSTWFASLSIGDILAGAISDVLTVRRETQGELSLWTARIVVEEA